MFAAVLDTCVLWPSLQRDVLLSWAVEGLYRPLWSSAILAELEYHETEKRVIRGAARDAAASAAYELVHRMSTAFDDACVTGWEPLEGTYGLPDPDDEHVVAAAVVGGAGAIVTENLRDLPRRSMPAGIQVLTSRAFAADTVSLAPTTAMAALSTISARYTRPACSVPEILDILRTRYGWDDAVAQLRDVARDDDPGD